MLFARSAAMAFNRYIDRRIDAANPRTASREIPAGIISAPAVLMFVLLNSAGFVFVAWLINPLCFMLSPLALAVILGYSYSKRFTWLCHLWLGFGLGLAPVGAFMAVTGQIDPFVVQLGVIVMCWVAGFDIIYAAQDIDFDKSMKLHSIPVRFGLRGAFAFSTGLHILCAVMLIYTAFQASDRFVEFQWLSVIGVAFFLVMLLYQHLLVKPSDLSKVNLKFMTTNGIASLVFGTLIVLDLYF